MDVSHLVHAVVRSARTPALHFVLLGVLLHAWLGRPAAESPDATRIVVPSQEIARARVEFREAVGRAPTPAEEHELTERIVDREILYRYALRLGLQEQPVVRRRLAQIAEFVAQNPDEHLTTDQRADEAVALGLSDGDLIVRRILIDGARRVIRAPWLVRVPDDATLQAYLEAHPEPFEVPEEIRLTQVAVNRLKHGDATEADAAALAERLRASGTTPEEAIALGDALPVAAQLEALPEHELARKLGQRFAVALRDAPEGTWVGPIPSRYGLHVVYVHERTPAHLPALAEVHDRVRRRFLQGLADDWLVLRLAQLRAGFEIVLPEATS